MGVVTTVNISQDGVSGAWIRDKTGGVASGQWFKLGGVNAVSTTREVSERELLGNNVTYKSDSSFSKYDLALTMYGVRPDIMGYLLSGTLTVTGDRVTFEESSTGQPTQFELFIASAADGENGEDCAIGEYYPKCTVSNFNNAKTSGEYVAFELEIEALADTNGMPRKMIFDGDEIAFSITDNSTSATLVAISPADGATGVAVTAAMTAQFSSNMDNTSAQACKLYNDSTGAEIAATVTTATDTITITPDANLPATTKVNVFVPPTVEDSGNVDIGDGIVWSFTTV